MIDHAHEGQEMTFAINAAGYKDVVRCAASSCSAYSLLLTSLGHSQPKPREEGSTPATETESERYGSSARGSSLVEEEVEPQR